MGRKSLGKQAKTHTLQIRLTAAQFATIEKLGGSAWARALIEEKIAEQDDATERQRAPYGRRQ